MATINLSEKNLIIIITALAQLIQQLIANMTVVALPNMLIDLNLTADSIIWVNLIYLAVFVAFALPFTNLISQIGVKKSISFSIIILLISIIITVFSINDYMLFLSRFIQGISTAALSISLYIMLVEGLSDEDLGVGLGIVSASGYFGMLIAPSFMGFIILFSNWRSAFLLLIPILITLLIALQIIKKEWIIEKGNDINYVGSLLYIAIMFLFTLGLTTLDEYGIMPLIISIVLLIIFVKYEISHPNPIYDFKLLKNIKYLIGNYAAMVTYFTTTIAITALTFHLRYVLDYEEYFIGLILMISPIIMIGLSGLSGKLSNKIDPRTISGIAMMFICISMVFFFFLDFITLEMIYLACVLQGIGNGLFFLTLVDEKDLPDASSFLSSSKEFGKILSYSIYALILSIFIDKQPLTLKYLNPLIIKSTEIMMFINILIALSATILLFYSKYKYERR